MIVENKKCVGQETGLRCVSLLVEGLGIVSKVSIEYTARTVAVLHGHYHRYSVSPSQALLGFIAPPTIAKPSEAWKALKVEYPFHSSSDLSINEPRNLTNRHDSSP